MRKTIAYCGLDCEKCDAYLSALHNDAALREKTAKLWSKLNGVTITSDQIYCEGCRTDGLKTPFCDSLCEIRKCAAEKDGETCGACPGMESCRTVGAIIDGNETARKNLKGEECL